MKGLRDFFREEDGMGTVEIILIIVVLIGLVVIFKKQITSVLNTIVKKISKSVNSKKKKKRIYNGLFCINLYGFSFFCSLNFSRNKN